jgi:hypothetical protein
MTDTPTWQIKGDWFDVCSCNLACPCEFAEPPTDDHCEGVLAWHVREGFFGEVRLDDMNVVAVSKFDGNVWAGAQTMRLGMFVDERADAAQRDALAKVFSGAAGGFMATFANIISETMGVEPAPITFDIADDLAYWSVTIPGKVDARAEALGGPTTPAGKRVQLFNMPGSEVGPGDGPATWGKATVNTVAAYDYQWDWAGKSSKHIPFDWVGP